MNVAPRPQYGPLSSPSKSSISFAHRSVTKLDFINFSWTFAVVKSKGLGPMFLLASLLNDSHLFKWEFASGVDLTTLKILSFPNRIRKYFQFCNLSKMKLPLASITTTYKH